MNQYIEGTIIEQSETQRGQSLSGKEWMKVRYIIKEDGEGAPQEMMFDIFGEEMLRKYTLRKGEHVRIHYKIFTKRFKEKIFNVINVTDVERVEAQAPKVEKTHTVVKERLPWEKND